MARKRLPVATWGCRLILVRQPVMKRMVVPVIAAAAVSLSVLGLGATRSGFSLPPWLRSTAEPEVLAVHLWNLPKESFLFWIESPLKGCGDQGGPCHYRLYAASRLSGKTRLIMQTDPLKSKVTLNTLSIRHVYSPPKFPGFLEVRGASGAVGVSLHLIEAEWSAPLGTYSFKVVFDDGRRAFFFRHSDDDFVDELIAVDRWEWQPGHFDVSIGIPSAYEVFRYQKGSFVRTASYTVWPPPRPPGK